MKMELNLESISLRNKETEYKDVIKAECKTEIDSSTISKILGIYVKSTNSDSDFINGQIKYRSQVIYSICYIDNDKKIRKFECAKEIAGEISNIAVSSGYVKLRIKPEKTEGDLSGLHLTIKAIFSVYAFVSCQERNEFVLGGENLICKKNDCDYYRSYGKRKCFFPIEEEFTIDYKIENVLNHKITPVITAVQCGVGAIIIDGEVYISALLLQSSEKCDIIREQKVLPFRAELEYEEAMPQMMALAEVIERNFKTDISVDEENNESVVVVSISLLLEGEAFSKENCVICDDCFSLQKELSLEVKVCDKVSPLEQRSITQDIKCSSVVVDGVEDQKLLAVGYERVELVDVKFIKDSIMLSGIVSFTALYKNEQGEITFRKIDSDFNSTLVLDENDKASYQVSAFLVAVDVSANGGALDVNAKVNFLVVGAEKEKIKLLQAVNDVGEKQTETASISVYIAYKDEELWSLAKRLNTPPEEICEINKELQFPLTGKERIVIYRQK